MCVLQIRTSLIFVIFRQRTTSQDEELELLFAGLSLWIAMRVQVKFASQDEERELHFARLSLEPQSKLSKLNLSLPSSPVGHICNCSYFLEASIVKAGFSFHIVYVHLNVLIWSFCIVLFGEMWIEVSCDALISFMICFNLIPSLLTLFGL